MDDLLELTTRIRRTIHAEPEIGLDNPRTQSLVMDELSGLPYELSTGTDCSSVTAVLKTGRPGPVVLLRADTDALPVAENTGLEFAAKNGAMHACGHDLHTAMLLGAAHLLADKRDALSGEVVLAFQPGEEGFDGAGVMLAEGLLDKASERPSAAYAIHVISSLLPAGITTSRPGPLMSAADRLHVTVRGVGGHGSVPYRARDPLLAAAAMLTALEVAVTREFDIWDPVVVTTGVIKSGEAHNVIPDVAFFESTVRSFSPVAQARLMEVLPRVCKGVALTHGVEVDVDYQVMYPPTINDEQAALGALDVARELIGPERVMLLPNPTSGSEDFSRMLEAVPGAMVFLGATPTGLDPASAPYNHAPEADFDESVMPDGARLLTALVEQHLANA